MKIQLSENELRAMILEAIEEAQDEGRIGDFFKGAFGGKTAQQAGQNMSNAAKTVGQGAQKAGQAVASGAKTFGQNVANGAQKVGQAVANGAKAVGQGAQKAGQAVANGAKAVGQGVQNAGQAVANGAKAVGQGVQNAVNDGRNAVLAGKLQNQWNTFQQTLNSVYQNSNGPQGKFTQSSIKQINKLINDLISKLQNSEAGYGYSEEE